MIASKPKLQAEVHGKAASIRNKKLFVASSGFKQLQQFQARTKSEETPGVRALCHGHLAPRTFLEMELKRSFISLCRCGYFFKYIYIVNGMELCSLQCCKQLHYLLSPFCHSLRHNVFGFDQKAMDQRLASQATVSSGLKGKVHPGTSMAQVALPPTTTHKARLSLAQTYGHSSLHHAEQLQIHTPKKFILCLFGLLAIWVCHVPWILLWGLTLHRSTCKSLALTSHAKMLPPWI